MVIKNMSRAIFWGLVIVGLVGGQALAAQHEVGGSQGWDASTDLDSWASGRTFKVGDQLVFKYGPGMHSVVELGSESVYKSCDLGSALDSMSTGKDVVKLNKVGTRYFACGTPGHCDQGMKLKIKTVSGSAQASPADTSAPPASTSASADPKAIHSLAASMVVLVFALLYVML